MNLEIIKKANTQFLGKNIIYFPEITSTQDYAKNLKKQERLQGTIILADYQTNGKGTYERTWHASKEKNITFTLIWFPNVEVKKLDGVTVHIAEAIQNAIYELYGYKLTIKKPNDLLLNGKKIAGILTQSTSIKNNVKSLYIGIGFNVNEQQFPKELQQTATSLKQEYSLTYEREQIIAKILEKIENVLMQIQK